VIEKIQVELKAIHQHIIEGRPMDLSELRRQLAYYVIFKMCYDLRDHPTEMSIIYIRMIRPTLELIYPSETKRKKLAQTLWDEIESSLPLPLPLTVGQIMKSVMTVHQQHDLHIMYIDQQLSPYDIYILLIDIFELNPVVEYKDNHRLEKSTIYLQISVPLTQPINLSELITIVTAPFLIISVQKLGDPKLRVAVYPDMTLKPNLVISSIIVQNGTEQSGHYVTYLRCDDGWYLFDDMSSKQQLKHLTNQSLDTVKDYQSICRNAVYYIYVPQ
jgi:isoleucyl-tRNA synthetase